MWIVVLAILVVAVVAVRSLTRERVPVHVAKVTYQDLVKTVSTNGKVELTEDFPAHAAAAGVVEDIYVDVGEQVKSGQLLLKMDDADAVARLASANSALRAAELAVSDVQHGGSQDERNTLATDLSRNKLQRERDASDLAALEKLQQQGAVSPAEVAAVRQRLQIGDSNIRGLEQHGTQRYDDADRARAEAQLADARAAVSAARSSYDSANVRSPIAGTVYSIPVSQYDYVPAGEDLIYVADLDRIEVLAYFDEPEIGQLAEGQPVRIVWDAKPGQIWHGHVLRAPTTVITYTTRNVGECVITVDDAKGDLPPNSNVTVFVTEAQHPHVLSIPREALHTDGANYFVFRVVKDALVRTPVQVGKGGIVNLSRQLAVDYGPDGLRVNAICPGYIDTDMGGRRGSLPPAERAAAEARREASAALQPIGRQAQAQEVARVATFLASDEASFMTGSIVTVDGGCTATFRYGS